MNRPFAPPLVLPNPATTQASSAYDRLREDLLSGRLEPGRRLTMRFLTDAYQTGQTPLREALNRLIAEDFVGCHDQRGFYVTSISQSELAELTETRCGVESLALAKSMARTTDSWEEALVVAHHRLTKVPRSLNTEKFEDNPEWERRHQLFHATLIDNCGLPSLTAFCKQLSDRLYRYRRLSISRAFLRRNISDEHKALVDAVVAGEAEKAVETLCRHYTATAAVIQADDSIFATGIDSGLDAAQE